MSSIHYITSFFSLLNTYVITSLCIIIVGNVLDYIVKFLFVCLYYALVHSVVKRYTADYDRALIFNKVHHELNQVI